ncbi:hypothetical protein FRB94_005876 [Tulasnella sp. JGI-2019a]|nr:hypothetical protein FRB93_006363 [Tulasnella sp. JGI-2019a]KAG8999851.1 hypothetical protein FRB94_005876 [Tulasnella sp. JGI-2019a]KAG9027814.1 hypothetical protein FRB95_007359 [Tulasnella sp. JGI-2019a]
MENDQLHRELQQLRAQLSASGGSDDGHSSSPPPSMTQFGIWQASQGMGQSTNQFPNSQSPSAYSMSQSSSTYQLQSASQYTESPAGYLPQTSSRGSYQAPPMRYNPMGPRLTHRGDHNASGYDMPVGEVQELLMDDMTGAAVSMPSNNLNANNVSASGTSAAQDPNNFDIQGWYPDNTA